MPPLVLNGSCKVGLDDFSWGACMCEEDQRLHDVACELAEAGDFHQAADLFRKYVGHQPRSAMGFEMLAQCLMEIEEHGDALVAACKATEIDPAWCDGFHTLGRAARNYG